MPTKRAVEKKSTETEEAILDSYESWLERQPLKSAKGKSGFIPEQKIEEEEDSQ